MNEGHPAEWLSLGIKKHNKGMEEKSHREWGLKPKPDEQKDRKFGFCLKTYVITLGFEVMVRFDKPCVKVSGAVEYFREHMAGDYLTQGGQAEMVWQGAGAGRLGLQGRCHLEDFEKLCKGQHPVTGQKLSARDRGAFRRVCFFAQLSAPKDVSIACLVGGDERIRGWWEEAVRETLLEIEAVTATRVRRDGANGDRPTGEMVAAVVTHDTNRALDPQLHTHVCIMNVTFDATEGRWKSVQPSAYYQHQGYFREVCYNKLAQHLVAAGYELESARGIGFHLKGFPPELRDRFSKRRREILRQAAATGATSQDELQAITARSRAEKTTATAAGLQAGWYREAGADLEPVRQVIAGARGSSRQSSPTDASAAVRSAEAHVFERRSVVDERVLLREALVAGRGTVALAGLKSAIQSRVESGELLRGGADVASRDGLAAEYEFLGWAEAGRDGASPLGRTAPAQDLAPDQASAVSALLRSRSRVTLFQGDAGTGKTMSLRAVVAGIERSGGRVFGCAPSAGATDVLRRELTADADTLQQLLVNPTLQQSLRGRVVIVDEAGLVSVREMRDLCRLAAAHDYRLLLVGDTKQHSSVEAGDALRCLQKYARVPMARLTAIRRQQDPRYRAAVARLARGDAYGAFNAFVRLGAVHEARDRRQLFGLAAEDYVQTVRAGKSCLVISPVWAEIRAFTTEVRDRLKAVGLVAAAERPVLTVHSLKWTREEKRRIEHYRTGDVLTFYMDTRGFVRHEEVTVIGRNGPCLLVQQGDGKQRALNPRIQSGYDVGLHQEINVAAGDRLMLRANLPESALKNGDLVEVAGFRDDGAVHLKDGRTIPPWFRQFSQGYAATSHGSQGKTVDRGILIMADEGISAGNLKQAYVSNSRFRESQMIYVSDLASAREAMARPGDRMLASELIPNQAPESKFRRSFLSRLYRGKKPPTAQAMMRGYPDALGGTPVKVATGSN
jgi:conjugative relaxase-like TrwC/TraI family protein